MGSGFTKGGRDFLELGTWNVMCARCGRKRKAYETIRDDEFARGLWLCPEHADPRHPQDFARGIKEDMTAPFVQPPIVAFVSLNVTFPVGMSPAQLTYTTAEYLETQADQPLTTESSLELVIEGSGGPVSDITLGPAVVLLPPWVVGDLEAPTFQWTWQSGGTGIEIESPDTAGTTFYIATLSGTLSGVAQCLVTSITGAQGIGLLPVSAST